MTTLCSIPILSYSPLAGPTVVGLIHSVDKELSIEDITSNLRADAEIGSVRRLGNTNSVKITFRGNRLPSYVLLGHVRHPVSPFKARPIQCFNCFGFGHKQVACKRPKTCRHCAQHHDQTDSTCLSLPAKCVNCGQNHEATARSCPKGREVETIQTYSKANSVDFHAAKSALEHEELFPALEFTPADSSVTKELAAASGFKDIAGNKGEHSKKPTALATPYASVLKATKPKAPKSQGVRQGSTSQGIHMSAVSETPPPETTQSDLQLSTVRQRRQVREADAKPSNSIRATPAVSVRAARHGGRNTRLTCPSILQWNARGLRRRLPDLRQHLIHSPADVLAIQEPMTRPGDFRFFPYVIHHSTPARNGGRSRAALLVTAGLAHNPVDLSSFTTEKAEFAAATIE
ncbi:hypothetical protein HPB47_027784, partial [Ixodes persulcatus]